MQILENVYIRELKPILNRQYMNSAKFISQGMLLDGVDTAVDRERVRLRNLLSKNYRRIAAVFGEKVFKAMEEAQKSIAIPEIKGPKDEFWAELNSWMSTEAGRKIRHIQDTTKRNIARTIRKGMEEGESHRTIAKRVRKTGRISTPRRAVTIARTETHTASVKSVDSAIGSTRILMEREWVSARDDRTRSRIRKDRFEHYLKFPAGPDGEKVAQDGKFTKTGEALSYPGDPAGSAANTVQCRCVLLYKPVNRMDKLKPYEPEQIAYGEKIESGNWFKDKAILGMGKAVKKKAGDGEAFFALDAKTGKSILERKGAKDHVRLDDFPDILKKGKVKSFATFHNHPSDASYGPHDLNSMVGQTKLGGRHHVVFANDGTKYKLIFPKDFKGDPKKIVTDWAIYREVLMEKHVPPVLAKQMTEHDAWKEHSHEIIEKIAKKYGLKYERVRP